MKWISIRDSYPKECLYVLVALKDDNRIGIGIAYWLERKWWGGIYEGEEIPHIDSCYEDYRVDHMPYYSVTHWMPLPEKPYEMD